MRGKCAADPETPTPVLSKCVRVDTIRQPIQVPTTVHPMPIANVSVWKENIGVIDMTQDEIPVFFFPTCEFQFIITDIRLNLSVQSEQPPQQFSAYCVLSGNSA